MYDKSLLYHSNQDLIINFKHKLCSEYNHLPRFSFPLSSFLFSLKRGQGRSQEF